MDIPKVNQRIRNVEEEIENQYVYDIYRTEIYETFSDKAHTNGWKLSLQGHTTKDGLFLYHRLIDFLDETQTAYKLATVRRYNHTKDFKPTEQSKKGMTIYIRNDWDTMLFAEEIYKRIKDYKGWQDIPTPTSYEHYAGAVYIRNDRDENSEYIRAN